MVDIDFSLINQRLLTQSQSFLSQWFPAGKIHGREYQVGALDGREGSSLSINMESGKWQDFASGEKGGDLISLYAAMKSINQGAAARELAQLVGVTITEVKKAAHREVVVPVPDDAPTCNFFHTKYGEPSSIWTYRDAQGQLLGHIARYDPVGEKKQIVPFTFGSDGRWGKGQWPAPRPLYGLESLAMSHDAYVLVVEGEKAADAARQIVSSSYVVVTWPGGCQARSKVDWKPLRGRKLLLWPDADKPGVEAMWAIGHELVKYCPEVKIVLPEGVPEGWDAADAVAEGWTWLKFKDWAKNEGGKPLVITVNENGGQGNGSDESASNAGTNGTGSDRSHSPVVAGAERAADGRGRSGVGDPVAAERREPATVVATGNTGAGPTTTPAPPTANREISWYAWKLDVTTQGQPVANLNNAVAILEKDPAFVDLVWYDTFLQRILTRGADAVVRPWTEADDKNLRLDFQRRHGITRMGAADVEAAVVIVAMRNLKNCVTDWLGTLKWDGVSRVENFFEDHFGAPGTEYTRAVSRIFWLSLVARVFDPGCKVDTTLVLEGEQGRGKSQAVEIIGGEWYMEQKEDVEGKDFFQVLKGKWVVEISEMESFSRAEMSRVKQAISCRTDTYRGSYAKEPADHKRQCVFTITTNNYTWNRDDTGARRFLPIRCGGDVDIAAIRMYRCEFFAEAVSLYNAAASCPECQSHPAGRCARHDWWTTPGEATKREQQDRYDGDPWTEPILEFIGLKTDVNVNEILTDCLKKETAHLGRTDQMRVAGVLRVAGWHKLGKVRVGHSTIQMWRRAGEQ